VATGTSDLSSSFDFQTPTANPAKNAAPRHVHSNSAGLISDGYKFQELLKKKKKVLMNFRIKGSGDGLKDGVISRGAAVDADWNGFETAVDFGPPGIHSGIIFA
jgi:hypothetical protein